MTGKDHDRPFFFFSLISNFIISFIKQQSRDSRTHRANLKFCFEQNGFSLFHIHAQAASLDRHFSFQRERKKMEDGLKT